jgi:hypothetical protein
VILVVKANASDSANLAGRERGQQLMFRSVVVYSGPGQHTSFTCFRSPVSVLSSRGDIEVSTCAVIAFPRANAVPTTTVSNEPHTPQGPTILYGLIWNAAVLLAILSNEANISLPGLYLLARAH